MSQERRTVDSFLVLQNSIVNNKFILSKSLVAEHGLIPGKFNQRAYLVALQHRDEISKKVADFGSRIAGTIPFLAYGAEQLHTTLSDYELEDLEPGEVFSPNEKTLYELEQLAANSIGPATRDPTINYASNLVNNQNSVITYGIPSERFVNLANRLADLSKESEGPDLRMPWGTNITLGRVTEPVEPKDLGDFKRLMREVPDIGYSTPQKLFVGYFTLTKDKFDLTKTKGINLS